MIHIDQSFIFFSYLTLASNNIHCKNILRDVKKKKKKKTIKIVIGIILLIELQDDKMLH